VFFWKFIASYGSSYKIITGKNGYPNERFILYVSSEYYYYLDFENEREVWLLYIEFSLSKRIKISF
jgi:hypothetical protein